MASDMAEGPLEFRCCPGLWCNRRLLPGFQGVGLISVVQDAGLASLPVFRELAWPEVRAGI